MAFGLLALAATGCAAAARDLGLITPPQLSLPAGQVAIAYAEAMHTAGKIQGALDVRCAEEMQGPLKADPRTCKARELAQPLLDLVKQTVEKGILTAVGEPDIKAILMAVAALFRFVSALRP